MIEAILFDLDDTLLGNNIAQFMSHYFSLLGAYAQQFMDRDHFLQGLMRGSRAMLQDVNPTVSNRDVFWQVFKESTGSDPDELEGFFDHFYRNQFVQLKTITQLKPEAAELVRYCFQQDLKVVVATNPMFPRVAVEARLAWAGVPATDFDYDLVTTYQNMHATKPHQAYYREILEKIDCSPENALMVGDDWERDVEPAAALGLYTYWIQLDGREPPDASLTTAYGTLMALYDRLQAGWLGLETVQ